MEINDEGIPPVPKEEQAKVIDAMIQAFGRKLTKYEQEFLPYASVYMHETRMDFMECYDMAEDIQDPEHVSAKELANMLFYYPKHSLVLRGERVYYVHPGGQVRFQNIVVEVDEDWSNPRLIGRPAPKVAPPKKGYKPDAAELAIILCQLLDYVKDHNGTYMHLPYDFAYFLNTRVSSYAVRDFVMHIQHLMYSDRNTGGHDLHKFLKTLENTKTKQSTTKH